MAAGSVLASFGRTRLLCTASIDEGVPRWMKGSGEGWVTAEYSMLPGSTPGRANREAAKGKQSGRTQEIQRLIGRSLRSVVDMKKLGERQIILDCDALQADGGTRTTAISGAFVALHDACTRLVQAGEIAENPITDYCAAISVGIIDGEPRLDLPYIEDANAEVDMQKRALARSSTPSVRFFRRRRRSVTESPVALAVVAATANQHKLDEMRSIFGAAIELLPRPAQVPEVIEDAATFVGNARLKAVAIATASGQVALADDSGLEVDALDGAPGVESAYYGGGDHDDAANRARLIAELDGIADRQRTARFRTVIVLRWPDGRELVAQGTCEGTIGHRERGDHGFGYDSLFVPTAGDGRTFAEHTPAEKNAMSHRSNACLELLRLLRA